MNVDNQVLKDIRADLYELCRDLIRTPSLSGQEERFAKLVKKRMREFGYDKTTIDDFGNVIGIKEGARHRPLLLFDGHMDTVPSGERRYWREDPFSGKLLRDLIFGRGAVDMKGAIAAMIMIPRIMRDLGLKLKGRLATALVVLEEPCEGVGIRHVIEGGLKPDAVVLGEPSNLSLALGQRGRFEISIRTYGKTCHSSMPEQGINAIYKMAPIIKRLEGLNKRLPSHPILGPASIAGFNITSSPKEGNVVPDICELLLDRRTLPDETRSGIIRKIENVINSKRDDIKVSVHKRNVETYTRKKLNVEQAFPGWLMEKSHWLVCLAENAANEALGNTPMLGTWRFGTDGTYTAGVRNIPTIGFGPGNPEKAHTPNENVSLSEITSAAMVYAHIVHNWT